MAEYNCTGSSIPESWYPDHCLARPMARGKCQTQFVNRTHATLSKCLRNSDRGPRADRLVKRCECYQMWRKRMNALNCQDKKTELSAQATCMKAKNPRCDAVRAIRASNMLGACIAKASSKGERTSSIPFADCAEAYTERQFQRMSSQCKNAGVGQAGHGHRVVPSA
jgi:hypothetical protein